MVTEIVDEGNNDGSFSGSFGANITTVSNFVAIGSGADEAAFAFVRWLPKSEWNLNSAYEEQHIIIMLETMQTTVKKDKKSGGLILITHLGPKGIRYLCKVLDSKVPLALSKLRVDLFYKLFGEAYEKGDQEEMQMCHHILSGYEEKYRKLYLKALLKDYNEAREKLPKETA